MSTVYPTSKFLTKTEPKIRNSEGKIQYDFNALLARRNVEFQFVDYLFASKQSDLCGAVGTTMRAVSPEEVEETEARYRDRDESPLDYIFEEQNPDKSWEEWIDTWFKRDGYRMMFDLSYAGKYGPVVKERVAEITEFDFGEVELVECVGGGRMFNRTNRDDYDEVYDHELFRLVKEAETNGLGELY